MLKKNKYNNKKNIVTSTQQQNKNNIYGKLKNWLINIMLNKEVEKNKLKAEKEFFENKEVNLNDYNLIINKNEKGFLKHERVVAQDSVYNYDNYVNETNLLLIDNNFMGYQEMGSLSQNGILRRIAEEITADMLRKGFTIKDDCNYDDEENQKDKIEIAKNIKMILNKFDDLKLNKVLKKSLLNTFIYGGNLIYFGFKNSKDIFYNELTKKNDFEDSSELLLNNKKIKKGSLTHLKSIEPTYITPFVLNYDDPTGDDFLSPEFYRAMGGHSIHKSRFCKMVQFEAPDFLKAKYMFFGIPLLQLLIPYARDFEKIRLNISKIVERFNLNILKVEMNALQQNDGNEGFENRVKLFTETTNNYGCLVIDKNQEEFEQIQIPLTNLAELMNQAAGYLSMISCIPQSKLFGQAVQGFNSSGDYEMRSYYDNIQKLQQDLLAENLHKILEIVQLDLFGEINQDLKIEFNSLFELDELQKVNIETQKIGNLKTLIEGQLLSSREALVQALKNGDISLLRSLTLPENFDENDYYDEEDNNETQ